tara:strand:+ start:342 stop:536 length:195 start_codon:yes stop_codon:yes gene_type:complete
LDAFNQSVHPLHEQANALGILDASKVVPRGTRHLDIRGFVAEYASQTETRTACSKTTAAAQLYY